MILTKRELYAAVYTEYHMIRGVKAVKILTNEVGEGGYYKRGP